MSDIFAALADPTRRRILERLHREGPQSVTELAAPMSMSRQAVSKHLVVLEGAGLVEREAQGRRRVNRVRDGALREVAAWLEACTGNGGAQGGVAS